MYGCFFGFFNGCFTDGTVYGWFTDGTTWSAAAEWCGGLALLYAMVTASRLKAFALAQALIFAARSSSGVMMLQPQSGFLVTGSRPVWRTVHNQTTAPSTLQASGCKKTAMLSRDSRF